MMSWRIFCSSSESSGDARCEIYIRTTMINNSKILPVFISTPAAIKRRFPGLRRVKVFEFEERLHGNCAPHIRGSVDIFFRLIKAALRVSSGYNGTARALNKRMPRTGFYAVAHTSLTHERSRHALANNNTRELLQRSGSCTRLTMVVYLHLYVETPDCGKSPAGWRRPRG